MFHVSSSFYILSVIYLTKIEEFQWFKSSGEWNLSSTNKECKLNYELFNLLTNARMFLTNLQIMSLQFAKQKREDNYSNLSMIFECKFSLWICYSYYAFKKENEKYQAFTFMTIYTVLNYIIYHYIFSKTSESLYLCDVHLQLNWGIY